MAEKKHSFFKKFRTKHPKVLPRVFVSLFIAGLAAGVIAFAVLLGLDPQSGLNQKSFIGFLDFSFIVLICWLLWYGFGPQKKRKAASEHATPPLTEAAVK